MQLVVLITDLDIFGTANPDTGEMGQIKDMSISGTPKHFFGEGVWLLTDNSFNIFDFGSIL